MSGMDEDTTAAPDKIQNPCLQSQDSSRRTSSTKSIGNLNAYVRVCKEDVGLADLKEYFKYKDSNVDLDAKDEFGDTALMIACFKGKTAIVEFLLKQGANPNLSNKNGETAMHFACSYPKGNPLTIDKINTDFHLHMTCTSKSCEAPSPICLKEANEQTDKTKEEDEKTVEIVKLLLMYNAFIHLNHDELSPVDFAALQGKRRTVEYILFNSGLSKLEELNALEIWAFALALQGKCSDAYQVLVKAMKKRHADPDHPITKDNKSELEIVFGQKESQTLEELNALEKKKQAFTAEAILTGDRVLSYRIKSYIGLYDRVANYALGLSFDGDTMEQGFSILTGLLKYEQEGLVNVGYVLKFLNLGILRALQLIVSPQIMDLFKNGLCKILKAYVHFLKGISIDSLHKNLSDVVQNLSLFLFYVGLTNGLFSLKDDFLVSIIKMINTSKIPNPEMPESSQLNTLSVSHGLLHLMMGERLVVTFQPLGELCKDTYYRFKRILTFLLLVEGALDVDSSGADTMLHTAMSFPGIETPALHELFVDLVKLLVRHGCPTKTNNNKGQTQDEIGILNASFYVDTSVLDGPDDSMMQEVYRLLEGPTEVRPLQELTVRAILYHRIPYHDKIPSVLMRAINGPNV